MKFITFFKRNRNNIICYGSLAMVVILFAIITKGQIFSAYNLKSLTGQMVVLMIISIGMIFMFSLGTVDIASGAVAGLCTLIITLVLNATGNVPISIFAAIVTAVALYLFMWFVTAYLGLMSIISSLAVMFIARGLVTYILSLNDGRINIKQYALIQPLKSNVAYSLAAMVVFAAAGIILFNYTRLGKYCKAIGDNPVCAEQSGARLKLVKFWCYVIAGCCVGVASSFLLARSGNVGKNIGSGTEMDVMVAVILGGMNLNGGAKSRIGAAITGVITYTLLKNGLTIANVSQTYITLVKGIIFIVIIGITLRQNKSVAVMPR